VHALESAATLARTLNAQIAMDASEVVHDMLGDRVEEMEAQYLLDKSPGRSYGDNGEIEIEVIAAPPPSLNRRGITLLCMMMFVALWTIGLTFCLVFVFTWYVQRSRSWLVHWFIGWLLIDLYMH
jgi:hypothetical protein